MTTATQERPRRSYLGEVERSCLTPPEVAVPKAVAKVAERARSAFAELQAAGRELAEARRLAKRAERDDLQATEAAFRAGEEPPDPIEPERREALAAAELKYKAAKRVAKDALYDQAEALAEHADAWRGEQQEAVTECVHEIEELLGSLLTAFRALRNNKGVTRALEHAGDPAAWDYANGTTIERDEARYETALKRARMPVARQSATVTKSVHDLLAALAQLAAEEAQGD